MYEPMNIFKKEQKPSKHLFCCTVSCTVYFISLEIHQQLCTVSFISLEIHQQLSIYISNCYILFLCPRSPRTSCCSGVSCQPAWPTSARGRSWAGATRPSRSGAWRLATWTGCSCTKRRRNSSSCARGMTR